MIAYTVFLQTEYQLRDFEKALALREVVGMLCQANAPADVVLYIGPQLYELAKTYGEIIKISRYGFQSAPDLPPSHICFFSPVEIPNDLLLGLVYAQRIERLDAARQQCIIPTQVYWNRLPKLVSNVASLPMPDVLDAVRCNKREHGYLSHSFHSYKGKYYPQLVGVLLNMCGVRPGQWVIEPFCGSGTTLVECSLRGIHSVGIDMNPLARLITQVKTDAISEPYDVLERNCRCILDRLAVNIATQRSDDEAKDQFLPENLAYLREWFSSDALAQINCCLRAIRQCDHQPSQGICLLTLSDNLCEISLQDPESLRVLRRKTAPPLPNLGERMIRGVEKRLAALEVQRFLSSDQDKRRATAQILQADARYIDAALEAADAAALRFKAAITSPPYATALPYIDSNRLNLFALGLLQKGERAELEWAMIGNREINDAKRRVLEEHLAANVSRLPLTVLEPIRAIQQGNVAAGSGFRRLNMGALLYKYFADMQQTFIQIKTVLEDGGYYVVVIGNSTTKVGDEVIDILTDEWLKDIAIAQGFQHCESFPMTDQTGYMRHSRNMIKGETIIVLRKPRQT